MARNLAWLIDRLQWVLSHDATGASKDFVGPRNDPQKNLREALNEAYKAEVEEAQQEVGEEFFIAYQDLEWTESALTLTVPATLAEKVWLDSRDITDDDLGNPILIGANPEESIVWTADRLTLQWGTTGAPRDTTIRISYLMEGEDLVNNVQEPGLIPARHRMIIVYAAAIELRDIFDEAPSNWERRLARLRSRFHKSLSRGRLARTNPPVIQNTDDSF